MATVHDESWVVQSDCCQVISALLATVLSGCISLCATFILTRAPVVLTGHCSIRR